MTVIAYSRKHKILAADSRCSNEFGMHLTNCQKIFRLKNGALLGTSGDSDDRDVRNLLAKATPRRLPSRQQLADTHTRFTGILVFPKGQVFYVSVDYLEHNNDGEWQGAVESVTDEVIAVGHGQEYAYGALDSGMTPQDAVRAACKRDSTCALPLQWEKL